MIIHPILPILILTTEELYMILSLKLDLVVLVHTTLRGQNPNLCCLVRV